MQNNHTETAADALDNRIHSLGLAQLRALEKNANHIFTTETALEDADGLFGEQDSQIQYTPLEDLRENSVRLSV